MKIYQYLLFFIASLNSYENFLNSLKHILPYPYLGCDYYRPPSHTSTPLPSQLMSVVLGFNFFPK